MKTIRIILLTLLFPIITLAQQSLLYNDNAEFRSNPTFTISKPQFEIWQKAEVKILSRLSTNVVANLKNELSKNKIIKRNIFSFDVDSTGVKNISQVYSQDKNPSKSAISHIEKYGKGIFKELNTANKNYFNNSLQFYGKYYISF